MTVQSFSIIIEIIYFGTREHIGYCNITNMNTELNINFDKSPIMSISTVLSNIKNNIRHNVFMTVNNLSSFRVILCNFDHFNNLRIRNFKESFSIRLPLRMVISSRVRIWIVHLKNEVNMVVTIRTCNR
ncbi:ORF5 [Porcine kirkovirus Cj-D43]|nr:ORF5 [Porcine kirkovirus Cj-D43]